ncbi:NIL domain-containing protein [Mesorhizobium sp. M1409]|uniref:NIL domain-containing protein n=1 Tax=unclassified Mesorhizobium TaxID=325217 RepID=UPI0033396799
MSREKRRAVLSFPILPPPSRARSASSTGGIDHVQRQPVGSLFLGVPTSAGHVRHVIDFLTGRGARVEVLGYVADND